MNVDAAEGGARFWITQADLLRADNEGDCVVACPAVGDAPEGSVFLYLHPPIDSATRDEDMAMHWIDRYAAGIDETCQLDRIIDALTPTDSGAGRDGWISVEDRLPEFANWNKTGSGEVAILNDRGEVMSAEWAFNTYASTERGKLPRWERGGRIYQGVVTHWQPLPAPPKDTAIAGAAGEAK